MASRSALPKIDAGPARHVYDALVLGGQLGGAVSAALLAKRGYRVLWVEHDGLTEGYEHEGYVLPFSPFVLPSLKELPVLEEVLTELGLNTEVQRALRPHRPSLQLALPEHRVELGPDEPLRLPELQREFPEQAAALDSTLKNWASHHQVTDPFFRASPNLPPNGLWEKFTLKRTLGRHPELNLDPADGSAELPSLLAALLPFLSYAHQPQAPLARLRPLSQVMFWSHQYPGGRQALRELLIRKLEDLGGKVLTREGTGHAVVEELLFDGGTLSGVRVVGSEAEYRASCIIAATDAGALRRLVRDKKRHRKLADTLELAHTQQFLFSLNWVLPRERIPMGMGDLVLVAPEGDTGPMLVQVSPAQKAGTRQEEPDEVTLCAAIFVPASARDLGEEHLSTLAKQLSDRLSRLMPFAREKVKLQSAPYLHASGVRGSRLLPHPLFQIEAEQFLGVSGLAPRTSVKQLFLANREVLPGLGLEGEFLSGARAARLVQEALRKSHPLKR